MDGKNLRMVLSDSCLMIGQGQGLAVLDFYRFYKLLFHNLLYIFSKTKGGFKTEDRFSESLPRIPSGNRSSM